VVFVSSPGGPDGPISSYLIGGAGNVIAGYSNSNDVDLVRGSAALQSDQTWTVVAYVTESGLADLQASGLTVTLLADSAALQARWDALPDQADGIRAADAAPNYRRSAEIDSALRTLALTYPTTCGTFVLNHPTWGGASVRAARIQAGTTSLTPVLFTGGVHAREMAPPDALLSFCDKLLTAYATGTGITYPPFTYNGAAFSGYTVSNAAVSKILNTYSLFVVPCVNPDGRDFVLSGKDSAHTQWRKNRRPDATCPGVDLNRNFPFVWDADKYFTPAAAQDVSSSKDSCNKNFRGYTLAPPPGPTGPEPETQNLVELVAGQSIQYLVDVHMFGRTVLYPWGMDDAQTTVVTQNFANPAWDGKRDGPDGPVYGEYLPDSNADPRGRLLTRLSTLADAMVREIAASVGTDGIARARSVYTAAQSVLFDSTAGTFDDYTFGQQFLNQALATTCAFTLECGHEPEKDSDDDTDDNDGGFAPLFTTQYPKVEREVHAALFGLLAAI
jgi:murein tripeptide amidase MpaA